ncbi:hypothetical protein CBF23_004460 [Marinomonas agarivorans]|nr:hypothetical protein CBF23_004460 [Marinomonas agarivorans]
MKLKNKLHKLALKLGNNPKLAFARLLQGGLIFLFGSLILILSERVIVESIQQELMATLGIIIAGIGVLVALVGYLSMSIFRLYHIINTKD